MNIAANGNATAAMTAAVMDRLAPAGMNGTAIHNGTRAAASHARMNAPNLTCRTGSNHVRRNGNNPGRRSVPLNRAPHRQPNERNH
jgi:hypothetical protein